VVDYTDKVRSSKKHYMDSNKMLYMSCAARFESVKTTTACVYYDRPKIFKNEKRSWRKLDPKFPEWRGVFVEVNDDFWKQTLDGRTIGVWRKLEEPSQSVVVLGEFRDLNKSWRNEKLKYVLTSGGAIVYNRINENGQYQNMVVKGHWL